MMGTEFDLQLVQKLWGKMQVPEKKKRKKKRNESKFKKLNRPNYEN